MAYTVKRNDRGLRVTIALEEWDEDANAGEGGWVPFDTSPYASAKLILKSSGASLWGMADIEAGGKVGYTWDADDLTIGGTYEGEVEFRNAGGTVIETVPNDGYFSITIKEDLG